MKRLSLLSAAAALALTAGAETTPHFVLDFDEHNEGWTVNKGRAVLTDYGEKGGDLCVIFPFCDFSGPVVKVLGKEKNGRLFFALARKDGTKLGK